MPPRPIKNLVVVSDTHCGCRQAICPPKGVALDDGGRYMPSKFQKELHRRWKYFWDVWVPEVTNGEPYDVLHNGDAIDGVHHGSTTQISNNLRDQSNLAYDLIAPIVGKARRYYHIRGTEAHVGKSASEEERLARRLGAVPNEEGQYARYDLWIKVGKGLVHALHHVGTTGSQAYEATAVWKEYTEELVEAARNGRESPHAIVRSHRHRSIKIEAPTAWGRGTSIVTPAWQGKTPFVWKIPGGRLSVPQFGGILLRWSDKSNFLYTRERIWTVEPSKTEI